MARSTLPVADATRAGSRGRARDSARHAAPPKAAPGGHPPPAAAGEVRIGPVAAIPAVLKKLGVAPSLPFVRAGVPLSTFNNPENRIAFEALGRLFSECSALTDCDHFGLLVGECFELSGLGAIGYRALKEIGGGDWKPLRVQFSHARPKDPRP